MQPNREMDTRSPSFMNQITEITESNGQSSSALAKSASNFQQLLNPSQILQNINQSSERRAIDVSNETMIYLPQKIVLSSSQARRENHSTTQISSNRQKRTYTRNINRQDLPLPGPIVIQGTRSSSAQDIPSFTSLVSADFNPLQQKINVLIRFICYLHQKKDPSHLNSKGKIHQRSLTYIDQELPNILETLVQIEQELSHSSSGSTEYESRSNQQKTINIFKKIIEMISKCLAENRNSLNLLTAVCQNNLISLIDEAFDTIPSINAHFNLESNSPATKQISVSLIPEELSASHKRKNEAINISNQNDIEHNSKQRKLSEKSNRTTYYCALEILKTFKHMFNDKESADLIFQVEGEEFYAHRAFLYHRSTVFKQMELGNFKETDRKQIINIDLFSKETFREILSFIYTGEVNIDLDNVDSIYRAADHYALNGLKILCKNYVSQNLSAENAMSLLLKDYQKQTDNSIYQETLSFVVGNAQIFFSQESVDFLTLPKDIFLHILQSNHLNLPEIEIMHVAVRWLEAQESLSHLSEVKNSILFTCLTLQDIWGQVRSIRVKQQEFCSPEELSDISGKIARKEIETPRLHKDNIND